MDQQAVLFLCVANSARSQMAEGIARSLAPAGVSVFSAGSSPTTINPLAITALAEIAIDISRQSSKSLAAIPLAIIGTAITLCGEEICPVFPGPGEVEQLHWPLSDPAAVSGDEGQRLAAFRAVRDELQRRIASLW